MQDTSAYEALTSVDAERATLSAITLDPGVLGWLNLTAEHFSQPLHRHVFGAMTRLWAEDKPLDDITIINAIEHEVPANKLPEVAKIIGFAATGDNVEHWATILEEQRRKRMIFSIASNATTNLSSGLSSADEAFDRMIEALTDLTGDSASISETMEQVGHRVLENLERSWEGSGSSRWPTGIVPLDRQIDGLPVGVPTALGARPGVGKSMTLWNICYHTCLQGEHAIILTNEDNADRSYKLGLANHSGVERRWLESEKLSATQRRDIRQAAQDSTIPNTRYHTVPVHGKGMAEICRIARGLCRRYNPKIVAIDYIQNVPSPKPGQNRNYAIEENLHMFDALVADEGVCGIIVGQLKRMEPGASPTMESFKDSGSIEQKAKLMLSLSDIELGTETENWDRTPKANFRIDVLKNSEGVSGFAVDCIVNKGLGKFSND